MSNKVKKWALGLAIIIAALATAYVAFSDNDPDTKLDPKHTIQEVQKGIEVIKDADEKTE